ncbi:unnamed protein product [Haemonchus placei]|uniref:Transcriptional regulator n=1 Tax=Haemonchus placei TaxID=6290 RepID=A0A0N4X9C7_HAEPC|nr:unnamed protein product [Haemonchus placei]
MSSKLFASDHPPTVRQRLKLAVSSSRRLYTATDGLLNR